MKKKLIGLNIIIFTSTKAVEVVIMGRSKQNVIGKVRFIKNIVFC